MDSVRSGPFGQIFRPDNFVFGKYAMILATRHLWLHTVFSFIMYEITCSYACGNFDYRNLLSTLK